MLSIHGKQMKCNPEFELWLAKPEFLLLLGYVGAAEVLQVHCLVMLLRIAHFSWKTFGVHFHWLEAWDAKIFLTYL